MKYYFLTFIILGLSMTAGLAQIKIMCLGDSITKGAVDPNPSMSGYRAQLFDDLNKAGRKYEFIGGTVNNSNRLMISAGQAYHNGFGSFRMDQIFKNLDGNETVSGGDDNMDGYWITGGHGTSRDAIYPDIVLLLGGTNDLGAGASESEMEDRMTDLLTWFQTNRPKAQFLVGTVPPRGPEKPGHETYNASVVTFNTWQAHQIASLGFTVHLVDIYALLVNKLGVVKGSDSTDTIFLEDVIHPSHNEYAGMGDAWFAAIKPQLPAPTTAVGQ